VKILLTGGRGLLGTPLAACLRAGGGDVRVTDMPEVEVTSPVDVDAVLGEVRPDVVVHLAAWTDVDGCERDPERAAAVNGHGTRIVAEACAAAGARLLYVSTDYVFDGRGQGAYTEDVATAPLSAYGESKLAGEREAERSGALGWITRCQSIYGRGKKSFADAILARARAGEPLRVVTDQVVCPTYAADLAAALAAVVFRAPDGLYLVANSGACTWYEFARAVLDESGFEETPIAEITAAELGRDAPRPSNSRFDCARLTAATGHVMRPWRDALRDYLAAGANEAVEDVRPVDGGNG
jgi:dTDP-4-dehydrorhamnose reductase